MDKDIKQHYHNVKYGKDLYISIPKYLLSLSNMYKNFSEINFVMNYYMFYENYIESYYKMDLKDLQFLNRFNGILKDNLSKDDSIAQGQVDKLNSLRNDIIKQMKILTNYTDIFEVYEYVLDRIKYKFDENLQAIDDDLMTQVIIDYIFETEEQVDIKSKLEDVISQLPVRMSRYKFFDYLDNSFSIFKGESPSSLESYLYVIKTNAMLYKPESMGETFEKLETYKRELEVVNFKDLGKEEFNKLYENLAEVTNELYELSDFYYGLQEMVNIFYVYLLNDSKEYSIEEHDIGIRYNKAHEAISIIVQDISLHYQSNDLLQVSEEVESLLDHAVGLQEELLDDINQMESIFSEIKGKHYPILENQGLIELYGCLDDSQKFFTNSLFFELDKVEDNKTLDIEEINKVKSDLLTDFEELFAKHSSYVNRAIMAKTLRNVIGFLRTKEEVEEYIKNSLVQCRDLGEKTASINIIKSYWE